MDSLENRHNTVCAYFDSKYSNENRQKLEHQLETVVNDIEEISKTKTISQHVLDTYPHKNKMNVYAWLMELEQFKKYVQDQLDAFEHKNDYMNYIAHSTDVLQSYYKELQRTDKNLRDGSINAVKMDMTHIYQNYERAIEQCNLQKLFKAPIKTRPMKKKRDHDKRRLRALELDQNRCPNCKKDTLILVDADLTCTKCGEVAEEHVVLNNRAQISYKEEYDFTPTPRYEKIEHFIKKLDQAAGMISSAIPQEVKMAVLNEIRIRRPAYVDRKMVRAFLKLHKMQRYYDMALKLAHEITNTPLPELTADIKDQYLEMFKLYQESYDRCPKSIKGNRSNMLSYNYVARKFSYILDYPEYANFFPLLSGQSNRRAYDKIWEWICADVTALLCSRGSTKVWKFKATPLIDRCQFIFKTE